VSRTGFPTCLMRYWKVSRTGFPTCLWWSIRRCFELGSLPFYRRLLEVVSNWVPYMSMVKYWKGLALGSLPVYGGVLEGVSNLVPYLSKLKYWKVSRTGFPTCLR
jgi:hypothetical protein